MYSLIAALLRQICRHTDISVNFSFPHLAWDGGTSPSHTHPPSGAARYSTSPFRFPSPPSKQCQPYIIGIGICCQWQEPHFNNGYAYTCTYRSQYWLKYASTSKPASTDNVSFLLCLAGSCCVQRCSTLLYCWRKWLVMRVLCPPSSWRSG